MKLRKSLFLVASLAMIAALVACGGTSTSSTTPPPTNTAISVSLTPAPTASMAADATQSLTAVVSNDSSNSGVTWTVTCSKSLCGGFSSASTASGTATTYTAPPTAAAGSVTVTATSVADTTKSASATITITVPTGPPLADGTYVFSLAGTDKSPSAYFVAGAFVVSGGLITAGEQDYADYTLDNHDAINPTGSALATTSDGSLQIVLALCTGTNCATADTAIGVAGVETMNGTMISATSGRLMEFDASASSSGTLDLQTSAAIPSGGYAFAVQGINSGQTGLAIGGVINVDGPGTISGTGSVFDINNEGALFPDETLGSTSTVSAPNSDGRVLFALVPVSSSIHQFNLAGYIIDATHIRLVESSDQLGGTTGGTALGQGSNVGTFSSTSISGQSYVLGLTGTDSSTSGVLEVAGVLNTTSPTSVTGTLSYNDLTSVAASASVTAPAYTEDPTGRVTIAGVTDGTQTFNVQLYLDGNGNAEAITMDSVPAHVLAGAGFLSTGTLSASSFAGTYVMNASGIDKAHYYEFDAVGPIAAASGAFTGFADLNWLSGSSGTVGVQSPDLSVSGTFSGSTGVLTGNIMGLDVTTAANNDAFTYYVVDTTKVLAIETDTNQLTLGYFELQ